MPAEEDAEDDAETQRGGVARSSSRRNGPVLDPLGGASCYIGSASYDMPNPLRPLPLITASERFRGCQECVRGVPGRQRSSLTYIRSSAGRRPAVLRPDSLRSPVLGPRQSRR